MQGKRVKVLIPFVVLAGVFAGIPLAFGQGSEPPSDYSDLTLEQAQELFDPNDDPYVIVSKTQDGRGVEVMHVDTFGRDGAEFTPEGFPSIAEAGVESVADLENWVAALTERLEQEKSD